MLGKFLLCSLLYTLSINAQKASHGGKLPWVNGDMLKINKQGNRFVKVSTSSRTLEEARKEAKKQLVQKLASEKGVVVNTETILKSSQDIDNKNGVKTSQNFSDTTRVSSGDFEAIFSGVDEYYEYKNGTYNLWVLYLVAEDGKSLKSIPNLIYKVDNGAWRSVIVPGWAQYYRGDKVKGAVVLASEIGLLAGGLYLNGRKSYNDTRALEANSVKLKQEYRKRAKNYKNYSYVAFGAAAGLYIYNLVDAFTSKKGKINYDYKKMNTSFVPVLDITNDNCLTAGIAIEF